MRFVYFGYDFMLPAVLALREQGHELIGIFSFEVDNTFNFNHQTQALAAELGMPFILSKPEDHHLQALLARGCEVFLSAGYPHKIPPVDETAAYAVNIHPAYLPRARGLMPIPRIIIDNATNAAGFTAHKMTQHFDAGDILLQRKFSLSPRETVETYTAKISMRAPAFAVELFAGLPKLWRAARPQSERAASHFKPPTDADRTLDWTKTAEHLDRIARGFGRFGTVAHTSEGSFVVFDAVFWKENHTHAPGTIMARSPRDMTIACADGYACLRELYAAGQQP
jgi:methionyl-tRNA formyltransferase